MSQLPREPPMPKNKIPKPTRHSTAWYFATTIPSGPRVRRPTDGAVSLPQPTHRVAVKGTWPNRHPPRHQHKQSNLPGMALRPRPRNAISKLHPIHRLEKNQMQRKNPSKKFPIFSVSQYQKTPPFGLKNENFLIFSHFACSKKPALKLL